MSETLWITGAAGFSGSHLRNLLNKLPDRPRIVGIDVAETRPPGLDAYYRFDLNEQAEVARVAKVECPRWVIHLAGSLPRADDLQMWRSNVGATAGLLTGLRSGSGPGVRVTSVGSAAEYLPQGSEPLAESSPWGGTTAYGRSKSAQTALALEIGCCLGMEVMVARTFNLLGPGLPSTLVAGWLCEQFAHVEEGGEIVLGNTKAARDFVDVRDAVRAYWLVATRGRAGQVYNVCSGRATRVSELIDMLIEITGRTPRVRVDPKRIRGDDSPIICGDFREIRMATGWSPSIPLRTSLADMLEWLGVRGSSAKAGSK